jgi:hypothetical protein
MTSVFAPITKSVENEDGTMYVYGKATGPDLDLDYQRCDPEWLASAMPEWFGVGGAGGPFSTGGNIREQHDSKKAAGRAVEHDVQPDGHYIKAHIIDPVAVLKTKHGVYTGFSIGIGQPRVEKSTSAPNGIVKDGKIFEVSLVDRPALPTATFRMCKRAMPGMEISAGDFDSQRMLVKCGDFIEKSSDGIPEMTVKIGEAMSEEQKAKFDQLFTIDTTSDPSNLIDAANKTVEAIDSIFTYDDAMEFVKLTKASDMPPEYDSEQVDIENAQEAISILSQLIISEASEMADNPAEDCDINILLDAVSCLRHFICREQQQAMGADVLKQPIPILMAADPDLVKGKYSAEQLRQMLKQGKAMRNPNGDPSYPIADKSDLSNAIRAVGRGSGDHNSIRAYIKRRAKALGASDMIPDNWSSDGSNKTTEPDNTKVDEVQKSAGEVLKTTSEENSVTKEAPKEDPTDTVDTTVDKSVEVESEGESSDVLFKAFSAALEADDSPLLKSFQAIIEKSTAKTSAQLGELGERLGRVEQMATPGGPSLRRTEQERAVARQQDLASESAKYKALAINSDDQLLRQGYLAKAAMLDAEVKRLS